MCGVTGWVDFGRDLRGERATIEAMTATMACRGPDAGGVWCSEHAAIGHRRLAVIDIAGGEQPMRAPGEGGDEVVRLRRKSAYPAAADTAYDKAIDAQVRELLRQPDAPLFSLISREKLAAAYAENPLLPGMQGIPVTRTGPAASLLDVNQWLQRSGVSIRL